MNQPRVIKLRRLAEQDAIEIDDGVAKLIAETSYSDESLLSILHYLASKASEQGVEMTAEFVRDELGKI